MLAAVGVEFEAELADRDLEVAVGESLERGPRGGKGLEPAPDASIVVAAEPPPESLTTSSRSGSTRLRNRRSSSVSSAPSLSVSADANSFGSIPNSAWLKPIVAAGLALRSCPCRIS